MLAMLTRKHLVWIACALVLLTLFKTMKPMEAFALDGWLAAYGEFSWLEAPMWLGMNATAPPASQALAAMLFTKEKPRLVAIENKKSANAKLRLSRVLGANGALSLDLDAPVSSNLAESRDEVFAVMRSTVSNRYFIRSASNAGEYVGTIEKCERLALLSPKPSAGATESQLAALVYDDWIIEPVANGTANQFHIRTTTCLDGLKYYLTAAWNADNVTGKARMKPGTVALTSTNIASATWEFRAVAGPA